MSVRDFIKKSVLESGAFTQYDVIHTFVVLISALLLGCLIYYVYKKFYSGVVYSRSFAITLIGMTVLTAMVTLAISTNIVISLGMVGALSIVRYRTAVKDPMDLLYLFWAITTGITSGAGMYVLAVCSAVVIIVMIAIFYYKQVNGEIYIVIIHYEKDQTGDEVIKKLHSLKYFVKSKTMRGNQTELAIEVFCKNKDFFFAEEIRNLEGVNDVTLIQYNGEYHG